MEHLLNQLKQAVQIQESKTHDTQLVWVGDDIDFVNLLVGTGVSLHLQDDTYLIMVGDNYALFNKKALTEDLVDEIKQTLGI